MYINNIFNLLTCIVIAILASPTNAARKKKLNRHGHGHAPITSFFSPLSNGAPFGGEPIENGGPIANGDGAGGPPIANDHHGALIANEPQDTDNHGALIANEPQDTNNHGAPREPNAAPDEHDAAYYRVSYNIHILCAYLL